ncbi:hypothetical protein, partial [Nonomuraea dietziae]|uniref:hypothetical protein n=1 Tax=Nonomuraea dietziae TaxID=65515 RepID=UPI00332F6D6A
MPAVQAESPSASWTPTLTAELVVLGDHRTIAALVRRIVVRARTALAGSGARVLPEVPLRQRRPVRPETSSGDPRER